MARIVTGIVVSIAYAPVKGLALSQADEIELEPIGLRENRRFYLVGADGRLLNGKSAGTLVQVAATADRDGTTLSLLFPDGSTVAGEVELGAALETNFYGRPVAGHRVAGPFSEALSSFVGRPLELARVDDVGAGVDRGVDAAVSFISTASLDTLAREAGEEQVDGRRFRMLFTVDGIGPHAEDDWIGRSVAVGEAVVRLRGLVGRCAVTTHDPDSGVKTLDTLRIIRKYRSHVETIEPLPFGVFGGVERPGRVSVGDTVSPL